jgi:xanthine dehydrogenase accessory factor
MNIEILEAIVANPGDRVLCTVLAVKGSAPRHVGSRMLAGPEGRLLGSVGGGRGEAMVLAASLRVLQGDPATILEIDMQGLDAEGPDMVCGGTSRILVEPVKDPAPYRGALARLLRGDPVLLIKAVATSAITLWDGHGGGSPEARQALETGLPVLDEADGLLYDPLMPRDKLLILGAGHVGQALAPLAAGLGFQVTVGDDRPEFLANDRFPDDVLTQAGAYTTLVEAYPFDPSTYVVIVTRSHLCDLECVRAVLRRPYRYAGFMGSRRKTALILDQVAADGFDPRHLQGLHAPIGLKLGAETPQELAVAIAGELISVRRGRTSL